jgi:hypothetical protein
MIRTGVSSSESQAVESSFAGVAVGRSDEGTSRHGFVVASARAIDQLKQRDNIAKQWRCVPGAIFASARIVRASE